MQVATSDLPLGAWLVWVPKDWLRLVNRSLASKTLARSEVCVNRGQAWGSSEWVQATAVRLGLEYTFQLATQRPFARCLRHITLLCHYHRGQSPIIDTAELIQQHTAIPRVARIVIPDLPHHVTQRGNNRQDVFFTEDDRRLYLSLLSEHAQTYDVRLLGYCLMDNHVHLIALPSDEQGLAKALGRTHYRYTQYINRFHGRSGHLLAEPLLLLYLQRRRSHRTATGPSDGCACGLCVGAALAPGYTGILCPANLNRTARRSIRIRWSPSPGSWPDSWHKSSSQASCRRGPG